MQLLIQPFGHKENAMRRGRIFIYLALILIIGVAVAYFYLQSKGLVGPASSATPVPEVRMVEIITAGQNIPPGTQITEEMLSSIPLPEDRVVVDLFTSKADVAGQFAKYPLAQGVPITSSMVTPTTGNIYLPGSSWAALIPQGMTAIAIPITRLSSAGYAIQDGDYVDIIVSLLLVDVDSNYQSALPNNTAVVSGAGFLPEQLPVLTAQIISGGDGTAQGRTEFDATLNEALYIVPSELQRPRMVTQMILRNVQVLHVGTFSLPGEAVAIQTAALQPGPGATPAPIPAEQQPAAAPVVKPDIVTLMVTPQDAVTLKYLLDINASITLTLRNPNDQATGTETEAATLQYLLSQYNIPVPAKLPYAIEPRTDVITPPVLPNDAITVLP
ncbi:MAG: Flp pilus assembly protein CpaB [Anaerolinea sp.]|nr:Flp pilus assembly protein CpaB [Anaerolinea sp.]